MTRRLPDVAEVTSANVDNDAVLVRSESRGFVRQILLKHLFGSLPLLRGATALQKLGGLLVRGDGNSDLIVRISGGTPDNGSGRGARLAVAGNRNQDTPAPGVWRLQDAAGVWCTLYVDDNGVLRITRAAEVTALNPRPGREVREEAGFELHDGVTTEKTTIADSDRFFVSDEDEPGQPHRYVESDNLQAGYELKRAYPSTEMRFDQSFGLSPKIVMNSATIAHNLGRVPKMIFAWITSSTLVIAADPAIPVPKLLGPLGYYDLGDPIPAEGSPVPDHFLQLQPTDLSATSATIYARSTRPPLAGYIDTAGVRRRAHIRGLRFEFFG